VIKTKVVSVDGQNIEIIDGLDGITNGVSFNGKFFGGSNNDYFEVNHNVGELELFGEQGNDVFFLKAQLQERPGGTGEAGTGRPVDGTGTEVAELAGGMISAGAGDDQNQIEAGDKDVLIDYVENNRVEIFGGSGFDTVVVAGTALDDTFYVFNDNDGRQYIYGAGLKIEDIQGVERLALITGSGNDTVFLYGLDQSLSMLINTGSGDDRVILGGGEETFEVRYPASNAVYTVEQDVLEDVFLAETIDYNDLIFERRNGLSLNDKQEGWREFYGKWVNTGLSEDDLAAVTIDIAHWNLLEANLAVGLKLFAQAIEKANSSSRVVSLWNRYFADRTAFLTSVNELEQELQSTNASRWGLQTIDVTTRRTGFLGLFKTTTWSSAMYPAVVNGFNPKMPTDIEFETLAGVVSQGRDFFAGGRSLDQILFDTYLRPVVAYTIWGDMVLAEQVRQGTGLGSPRVESWGYEPDLYKGDLYTHQIPAGGRWMPHISGEQGVWIDTKIYSQGIGENLFWDLVTLFYDVDSPAPDSVINIVQNFEARSAVGAASYRFDELPERVVQ
jgi:hypothetical protein